MGKSLDRAVEHSLDLARRETERTMLACWPNEWREEFAEQNRLMAEVGEELLTPSEYLQCRADDLEEWKRMRERERLIRNLMGVVEDVAMDGGAIQESWRAVVDWETYSGEVK